MPGILHPFFSIFGPGDKFSKTPSRPVLSSPEEGVRFTGSQNGTPMIGE